MSTVSFAPSSVHAGRTNAGRPSHAPRTTAAPMSQRPSAALRLTRRGRAVVLGAALTGMVALGGVAAAGASGALHGGHAPAEHRVTVMAGDTLWDFAAKAAAGGDIISMERQIMQLNGLDDASLSVGQRLLVPGN